MATTSGAGQLAVAADIELPEQETRHPTLGGSRGDWRCRKVHDGPATEKDVEAGAADRLLGNHTHLFAFADDQNFADVFLDAERVAPETNWKCSKRKCQLNDRKKATAKQERGLRLRYRCVFPGCVETTCLHCRGACAVLSLRPPGEDAEEDKKEKKIAKDLVGGEKEESTQRLQLHHKDMENATAQPDLASSRSLSGSVATVDETTLLRRCAIVLQKQQRVDDPSLYFGEDLDVRVGDTADFESVVLTLQSLTSAMEKAVIVTALLRAAAPEILAYSARTRGADGFVASALLFDDFKLQEGHVKTALAILLCVQAGVLSPEMNEDLPAAFWPEKQHARLARIEELAGLNQRCQSESDFSLLRQAQADAASVLCASNWWAIPVSKEETYFESLCCGVSRWLTKGTWYNLGWAAVATILILAQVVIPCIVIAVTQQDYEDTDLWHNNFPTRANCSDFRAQEETIFTGFDRSYDNVSGNCTVSSDLICNYGDYASPIVKFTAGLLMMIAVAAMYREQSAEILHEFSTLSMPEDHTLFRTGLANYKRARLGWGVALASLVLTVAATAVLIVSTPEIVDIVLNVLALQFLTTLDDLLVGEALHGEIANKAQEALKQWDAAFCARSPFCGVGDKTNSVFATPLLSPIAYLFRRVYECGACVYNFIFEYIVIGLTLAPIGVVYYVVSCV